jgi:hypothetical protein
MKSDPVRSAVSTSVMAGTSVSAVADIGGGTTRFSSAGGAIADGLAAKAAAPTAAPFKKFRRSTTGLQCSAMRWHLDFAAIFTLYHMN